MLRNGLKLRYEDGTNTVLGIRNEDYRVGELLCLIFQGEFFEEITSSVRGQLNGCPFADVQLTQDSIEDAEKYMLSAFSICDFVPARNLAAGSFIRPMEDYRAMDSGTAAIILEKEKQRADLVDGMFPDVGFVTVGQFLRLCFNNYLIDLINGMELFEALGKANQKSATSSEKDLLADLCVRLNIEGMVPGIQLFTDCNLNGFEHYYLINSFLSFVVFEFSHLREAKGKLMKCLNPQCNKFFVAKRSNAKYCGFESPQHPGKSCSEYYPQYLFQMKTRENNIDHLIKNAKSRLLMAKHRHPEDSVEISGLLKDITLYAPLKKQEVLSSQISQEEFMNWLDKHRIWGGVDDDEFIDE